MDPVLVFRTHSKSKRLRPTGQQGGFGGRWPPQRRGFLNSPRARASPPCGPGVRPCARAFVRPSVHSLARPSTRSSLRPLVRPSVRPPVRASVRSFVRPSVRPPARPVQANRPGVHPLRSSSMLNQRSPHRIGRDFSNTDLFSLQKNSSAWTTSI